MTRRWPVVGIVLAALWLFVRGVQLSVWNVIEELLIGLAVGVSLAYATRGLYTRSVSVRSGLVSLPAALVYVGFYLWELIKANLNVAYRVIAPSLPIHPDVIEIPLRVETDLAITTIANSITLTPGTLTMDYDPDRNALYVHAIASRDRESVVAPIRRWEDYALVIFDEELDPGSPVPDPERRVRAEAEVDADTDTDAGNEATGKEVSDAGR